jgi:hypothetical protein
MHGALETRRAWEKFRRVQESGAEGSQRPLVLLRASVAGQYLQEAGLTRITPITRDYLRRCLPRTSDLS